MSCRIIFLRHLNLPIHNFITNEIKTRHASIFPFTQNGSSTTNRFNLLVKQYRVYFCPMVEAGSIAILHKIYAHVEGLMVALSNVLSRWEKKNKRERKRENKLILLGTGFAIDKRFVEPPVCDNLSNRWTFCVGPSFILSLIKKIVYTRPFRSDAIFFSYGLY